MTELKKTEIKEICQANPPASSQAFHLGEKTKVESTQLSSGRNNVSSVLSYVYLGHMESERIMFEAAKSTCAQPN